MALFKSKEERKKEESLEQGIHEYFQTIPYYQPAFRTFEGGLYEMAYSKAAVHAFANHCSNLKPVVSGSGNEKLQRMLQYKPNELMDTKKYLYRLATIVKVKNNAFIVPLYDKYKQNIIGLYPLHPDKCQIKSINGEAWIIYELVPGQQRAIRLKEARLVNQFQCYDEMFGDGNIALKPTLQLMDAQDQAIQEAIKNSSNIQFLAKLGQSLRPDDVEKERERFAKLNLKKNKSTVMMVDAKYAEVKQLESKQFTIDDKQMKLIKDNVSDYMGISENIIQNTYTSVEWNAYYEGQIEPFANELALVHTDLLFTEHEIAFGNKVEFSSNKMNYINTSEKVSLIQTLFDRGLITRNEAREILNMPTIENGDEFFIRKEYGTDGEISEKENITDKPENEEEGEQDVNTEE